MTVETRFEEIGARAKVRSIPRMARTRGWSPD